MSREESSDRTLPATPRRRQEARRQGQVRQSGDLSAALMTGGCALLLMWQGPGLALACAGWLRQALIRLPVLRVDQLGASLGQLPAATLCGSAAGLLLGLWLLAIIVRLIQIGPLLAPELVLPRTERVSLSAGLQRMFSASTLVRGPIWMLRLMVVGALVWWTLTHEAARLASLMQSPPGMLAVGLGRLLTLFALRLCGILLAVSALDFGWQWFSHERRLRMTTDEARAERRDAERPRTYHRSPGTPPAHPPAEPVSGV